jgi:hypothetical protein
MYKPTNREKAKTAKRTRFHCKDCDRAMINLIQKCPVCGYRENRKKI